jgi:hypothetical protein
MLRYCCLKKILALVAVMILLASIAALSQILSTTSMIANAQTTTSTTSCENLPIANVIASGSDSINLPKNAIDNNLNTRWTNLGIGSWIRVDLGAQKVICSVDIAWYKGNERKNNFVISISNDGSTFRDIFTGRSSGTTLSPEKYDIPDVIARYVKITVNGNTQNNYASITEIDVYGRNVSPVSQPVSLCTINLPITGVIASGNDGNVPSNTIDNNLNTRWSNAGIGSWIRVDLGVQKVICSVDIAWYKGNERQSNFVISVSNDGSTFTNVFSGKSSGKTLSSEKYSLPANTVGRYVKITVNGNTQNNYASITEIDVYGPSTIIIKDKSYDVNVLVIKYFPLTADGTLDINVTGEQSLKGIKYDIVRQKTIDITNNLVSTLGKASAYLGYMNSSTKPALRYHLNDTIEHKQAVPFSPNPPLNRPTYPDYYGIMQSHNICNYVDNKNVSEVWLFAYQGHPVTKLSIDESKMSGPFGDISNSGRYNDMPPCKKTYVVYTFNYARGTAEAMENWGHQIEAELSNINYDLFRNRFQGPPHPQNMTENPGITFGRCGSAHNPPNAVHEYDRANPSPWLSDCLDWNPDSLGILSLINCQNWLCDFPTCAVYLYDFYCKEADANNPVVNYTIWLWQNLPGINNTKTYQGQALRSWWDVYGNFDNVMANSRKLTR